MAKATQEITTYPPHIQKRIEQAIIFLIRKIEECCYNEKPLILHSIRVGLKLMELKEEKEVVIAGFLHDLLEDTDCQLAEIEEKFGKKVANLVSTCTFDEDIKDYKARWRKLISNIKKAGRDTLVIKLIDQMDNLPYYILISDEQKKREVMWKHKFFIDSLKGELKQFKIFQDYKKLVNIY